MINFLLSLLFARFLWESSACYVWGTDSGQCSSDTLNPLWREANMPYCKDVILYPACIPIYQVIVPLLS
jgi:hypothetical protein